MIYDFRVFCQLNSENFTQGVLQIALLCKGCGISAENLQIKLSNYFVCARLIPRSNTNFRL